MGLVIHVDGGSRGNPGPAGAGVVIQDDAGQLVYEAGFFLGRQTNNAAEYHALIRALERAGRAAPQPLMIHSDSELLVRQITGDYQVKSAKLAPLHRQVQMLLLKINRWSIRHVRREQNQRADELANLAMDRRRDVLVFDVNGQSAPASADTPALAPNPPVPAVEPGSAAAARHAVRVSVTRPPQADICPAGGLDETAFTVGHTLPAGLCIHAAHALLPTLLAMLNTEPGEFAAVPTLSVRCTHPGCRAEFTLAPIRSPNGAGHARS